MQQKHVILLEICVVNLEKPEYIAFKLTSSLQLHFSCFCSLCPKVGLRHLTSCEAGKYKFIFLRLLSYEI